MVYSRRHINVAITSNISIETVMKSFNILVTALFIFMATSSLADEGLALFEKYCIACHQIQGPPQVAPPAFGVINHVKAVYPERDAFIKRIVDWVEQPNPNDVLMPGAVIRFGVMPKLDYPREDVVKIAEFLYDQRMDLPQWYIEHYRQQHGQAPVQ
jgi:mono/diheme cytochrome c family protein